MGEIVERIPHKSVAYAFLEIRGDNANEFESLRREALKKSPAYSFAADTPAEPKPKVDSPQKVEADEAAAEHAGVVKTRSDDAPAPTDTPTEGLSPREKAKAKLAEKKAAQAAGKE